MSVRCVTAALGVAALSVAGLAAPAHAAPPVSPVDHYSGTASYDITDCGLDLHVERSYSGMMFIRPAPRSDEAFLLHDRYQFTERITLAEDRDGPFVTTSAAGTFLETRATLLDPAQPTIYQFNTVDAGTFRLFSSTGDVLLSSSGVIKAVNVQDTRGDKTPGSTLVEEVSRVFHGKQSGDFCEAMVAELT